MKPGYSQLISISALLSLVGYITSGPVGFFAVQVIHPQPAWTSAAVFAENYHLIQDVPFYFGFLLTGGMLMLVAAHYLGYPDENPKMKLRLLVSLGWTIAFFALISFNYICQTTFVRHLVKNYQPENDAIIAAFSMANPLSFCWANEMWGYGFLGVASWLMAGFYDRKNNTIRTLLIVNGIVSLATVLCTIVDTEWLLSPVGLGGYMIWNVLMIVLMSLIYRHFGKRNRFQPQAA